MKETLVLPFSESLKNLDFRPLIQQAQAAIPPGIRRRLTIATCLKYPIPIGFYMANNVFGKMNLQEKGLEEEMCYCKGKTEFFDIADCEHIVTTNPDILLPDFPTLFELCKKGGKFRTQLHMVSKSDVHAAINSFGAYLERKYGSNDNELLTWCQMFKRLIEPLLVNLKHDNVPNFRSELSRAHKKGL